MRTLVIQRRKSSFAGLLKMYVYIEDHENPTAKIAGTPCRMIGKLQNGDTEVLDIPESACRIFVAARKPFGYLSSEVLSLPEGSETIYLTGQHRFDFFTGSPFRFDHIVNEETIRHRTRNTRGGLWVILATLIISFIIAMLLCVVIAHELSKPIVHTKEGFWISLPRSFTYDEPEESGVIAVYYNDYCEIWVQKDLKSITGHPQMIDFANNLERVISLNEKVITPITPNNGCFYMEYQTNDDGTIHQHILFIYMTPTNSNTDYPCYYRVTMSTLADNYDILREDFFEWAKTVEVE